MRKAVATLVAERLKAHIGPTDKRILQEFTAEFTTRIRQQLVGLADQGFARTTSVRTGPK